MTVVFSVMINLKVATIGDQYADEFGPMKMLTSPQFIEALCI